MELRSRRTPPHVWAYAASAVLVVVAVLLAGSMLAAASTPYPEGISSTEFENRAFADLIGLGLSAFFLLMVVVVQVVAAARLQRHPGSAAIVFLLLIAVGAGILAVPVLASGLGEASSTGPLAALGLVAVAVLNGLAFRAAGRTATRPVLG